jgi:hypothetical protein
MTLCDIADLISQADALVPAFLNRIDDFELKLLKKFDDVELTSQKEFESIGKILEGFESATAFQREKAEEIRQDLIRVAGEMRSMREWFASRIRTAYEHTVEMDKKVSDSLKIVSEQNKEFSLGIGLREIGEKLAELMRPERDPRQTILPFASISSHPPITPTPSKKRGAEVVNQGASKRRKVRD